MSILDQHGRAIATHKTRNVADDNRRLRVEVRHLRERVRASYDAAQTTPDNELHWGAADDYSARYANDPETRRKLRKRARYEVANNSYARGIVNTLANDVIGTGPRLQVRASNSRQQNTAIERAFHDWGESVSLAEKLRVVRVAKGQDGEGFGILATNPRNAHPIKLDIRLMEAEQCTSHWLQPAAKNEVDGIVFDDFGSPLSYKFLKQHPGDFSFASALDEIELVDAKYVLHLFRIDRPGQLRGLPDIMPALPLFALLRRYTLASVQAAEAAANMSMVLESQSNADTSPDEIDALEAIDIERGMLTTMPLGWKMNQLKAEQPTTNYPQFKHEILKEIARCLSMPFNVAAGDSSSYNYASGRLDHQTYFKAIDVERDHIAIKILNRIFTAWFNEAVLVMGNLFAGLPPMIDWQWEWVWPGREHVDPNKEATAETERLSNGTLSLKRVYGGQGLDWESELEQIALEQKRKTELGIVAGGKAPDDEEPVDEEAEDDMADEEEMASA